MNKLIFIFPISGPTNGVKVISKELLKNFENDNFEITKIDTAQAVDYSNFGKFNFKKIYFVYKILKSLNKISTGNFAYMNFTTVGFSFIRDFFIVLFLIKKKSKITLHIHQNGLELITSKFILKTLNKAKIVVINQQQFKDLQVFENLYEVHNVLPDFYNGSFNPLFRRNLDEVKLLIMSNLSIKKGIDNILSFCKTIKEKQLNYTITICGGVLDNYTDKIINKIIVDYQFITFKGPVENIATKMEIYKKHDFFLFLSTTNYEVSPLVYIEALMNGLPIITTPQIIADKVTGDSLGLILKDDNYINFISNNFNEVSLKKLKFKNREKFEKQYNFVEFYKTIKKIVVYET